MPGPAVVLPVTIVQADKIGLARVGALAVAQAILKVACRVRNEEERTNQSKRTIINTAVSVDELPLAFHRIFGKLSSVLVIDAFQSS